MLVLIEWPSYGIDCFKQYLRAFNDVGLHVDMCEMMDWGCRAFQLIGEDESKIPDAASAFYRGYCSFMPRNHDPENTVELMVEVIELAYLGLLDLVRDFFIAHRSVWVRSANEAGIVLQTEVFNAGD